MSVDISKPADQVLVDAKKDLAKAFPTEAEQLAAGDKFQAALSDEEAKKRAYEDIKKFAVAVRNLREDFIVVAGTLVGFDAAEFKDKTGNVIKLGPKWAPYISQHDETLQCSLEIATDAATMLKSITSILGVVQPENGADLKDELRSFIDELKKKEGNSSQVKDKFQKLADNVSLFSKELDDAITTTFPPVMTELDRAKVQLEGLKKDLKDMDEKINCLNTATVQMLTVGATAAAGTITELNPGTILIANSFLSSCGTGVALKKAMDERNSIIGNIEAKEREIILLGERNGLGKKYKTVFDKINVDIVDVSSRMNIILNIWNRVGSDLRAFAASLDANIHDGQLSKTVFRKIQVMRHINEHLILLLETYVEETRSASE